MSLVTLYNLYDRKYTFRDDSIRPLIPLGQNTMEYQPYYERGIYLDSLHEILGLSEVFKDTPKSREFNEKYFEKDGKPRLKESEYWMDFNEYRQSELIYYYNIFKLRMVQEMARELIFYPVEPVVDNDGNFIYGSNEELIRAFDEEVLQEIQRIYRYCQSVTDGSAPVLESYISSELDMNRGAIKESFICYIIYMINFIDVFGKGLPFVENIWKILDPCMCTLPVNFVIKDITPYKHILQKDGNYLLNLINYKGYSDVDKLINELEPYHLKIEEMLYTDTNILTSLELSDAITQAYIAEQLVDDGDLDKTTMSVNTIPIKTIYAKLINADNEYCAEHKIDKTRVDPYQHNTLAVQYFNRIYQENLTDKKKFKSIVRLEVEKLLKDWYDLETFKRGKSIQSTLTALDSLVREVSQNGGEMSYRLYTPTRVRVIIKNELVGLDVDTETKKSVIRKCYLLVKTKLGEFMETPKELEVNQHFISQFMSTSIDIRVFSSSNRRSNKK